MPDSTISGLPVATIPASNDLIPIVQGGTTKAMSFQSLSSGLNSLLAAGGALTLIAVIIPQSPAIARLTAANIFTSQWENYLIKAENFALTGADVLALQLCQNGTINTSAVYAELPSTGAATAASATSLSVYPAAGAANNTFGSFQIELNNLATPSTFATTRGVRIQSIVQTTLATAAAQKISAGTILTNTLSTVTGFSLFCLGGSNIGQLSSRVEVYGFNLS